MPRWTGAGVKKKFSQVSFHWIPKNYQKFRWGATIDGVSVRTDALQASYSLAVTEEIGQCNFLLNNNADAYNFTGGEEIRIFADYDDGTTLRWLGEVDNPEKVFESEGKTMKILGRHVSARLLDIMVTASFTDTAVEDIIASITADFATDFTYNKEQFPATTVTSVNWEDKPFWECLRDLAKIAKNDVFVDNTNAINFFPKGSTVNEQEAAVHDNILKIKGIGPDVVKVRNKIIVNGTDADGNPIRWTSVDAASKTAYKLKERVITDTSISTIEEAKDRADAELALLKDTQDEGEVESLIMIDMNPGDKIWIVYPMLQIRDTFRIVKFKTDLPLGNYPKTKVWINQLNDIPDVFNKQFIADLATRTIVNPERMEFSFNMTFDDEDNITTLTNLQVSGGLLRTSLGKTSGTMISVTKTAENNITKAYIIANGNNITGTDYWVSNNGGARWESATPKTLHTFDSIGKTFRMKVKINTNVAELDALVGMYS